MSLVPFEKPRPEDQLPDPFEGGERVDGDALGAEPQGLDAPAVARHGGSLRIVPRPGDKPAEPPLRRPPAGDRDRVLPFKRRQRKVPIRRRTPLRRWLRPFATAVAIVGTPVVLVLWLFTSSQFALSDWRAEVVAPADAASPGFERVPQGWVERRLAAFEGRNLFELDLRLVERSLRHPWVASVDLRKEFPDRLHARVVERQAVALWRVASGEGTGDRLVYLDGEAREIAPFRLQEIPQGGQVDLVLLSRAPGGEASTDAMARSAAVALLREIEALGEQPTDPDALFTELAEIEVLDEADFKIFTANVPFPLLVRAGSLETKTRRLKELLPHLEERHGALAVVDLRFRRRIIVEPSDRADSGPIRRNP